MFLFKAVLCAPQKVMSDAQVMPKPLDSLSTFYQLMASLTKMQIEL